jgi:hypothetical protein
MSAVYLFKLISILPLKIFFTLSRKERIIHREVFRRAGRDVWEGTLFPKSFVGNHHSTSHQKAGVIVSDPKKKSKYASRVIQKESLSIHQSANASYMML